MITQGTEVGLDDPINHPPFPDGQPAEFSEIYNPHPRKRWATEEEIPKAQPFENGFLQKWPELTSTNPSPSPSPSPSRQSRSLPAVDDMGYRPIDSPDFDWRQTILVAAPETLQHSTLARRVPGSSVRCARRDQ